MFGNVKTVSITSHLTEFAAMLKANGWQISGTKTMPVRTLKKDVGNMEKKLKSFEEIKNGMKDNAKTIEQINDKSE